MYKCLTDGFPFEGPPVLLPKKFDAVKNEFVYDNVVFCSPSCLKGYVYRDISMHADRIHLISMYMHRELGLDARNINICPDPQFIKDYMFDKTNGLDIETFRATNDNCIYATKDTYTDPNIDMSKQLQAVKKVDGCLDKDLYNIIDDSMIIDDEK